MEPEEWVKHTNAASCIPMIYSEACQKQSISCSMHVLWSSHGWKSGASSEAHPWHMQEGGFQIKSKDIGDGLERRYNSSNGNYPGRGSQFSFDSKWIAVACHHHVDCVELISASFVLCSCSDFSQDL